jgi:hypothetical protein
MFAKCKFDTPSSFQDILNNHTFSVRKCVRRNAREEMQAMVSMVRNLSVWSGIISVLAGAIPSISGDSIKTFRTLKVNYSKTTEYNNPKICVLFICDLINIRY